MVLAGAFLFPSALIIAVIALIRVFCPAAFSEPVTWSTEAWEKLRRNRIQQKPANSFFIRNGFNSKNKNTVLILQQIQTQKSVTVSKIS